MTKKIFSLLLLIFIFLLPGLALAKVENLMNAYYLGIANDPTFKSQYEVWMANRENAPIARANLLPQINFNGSQTRYYNKISAFTEPTEPNLDTKYYDNNTSYSLNLTQPIFNFAYWTQLSGAKASVKAATATFSYATQDLIMRVAVAYFAVLQAQDILYFTQAQKKAVYETLVQTQHKYDVGIVPITGVNEAQASYDTIVATEITNKTDLANKKEQLRVITGTASPVSFLNTLEIAVPLVKPNPSDMEKWVKISEMQNYQILAARYNSIAARELIKQQAAGHLPIINANAGYDYSYDTNSGGTTELSETAPGFYRSKSASLGLSVSLPIFSGGKVTASTIQAEHSYQKAVSDEDYAHKNVASLTRQSYLNVVSGINKILANKEEIKSKASSLRSTILSYEAGMRTMVDVLNAESDLYNAKKQYSISQYDYMLQTLYLKEYAGTLSPKDLEIINSWLMHSGKIPDVEQNNDGYTGSDATQADADEDNSNNAFIPKLNTPNAQPQNNQDPQKNDAAASSSKIDNQQSTSQHKQVNSQAQPSITTPATTTPAKTLTHNKKNLRPNIATHNHAA